MVKTPNQLSFSQVFDDVMLLCWAGDGVTLKKHQELSSLNG
jgi:hypothetical protein